MPILTITRGLPGCGKSHWASAEVQRKKNTVIVNRDDIRESMTGASLSDYRHTKTSEKYVSTVQISTADVAVLKGWNIIISDTNLSDKTYNFWKQYAKDNKYTFIVRDFYDEFKKNSTKNYLDEYFAIRDYVKQCKKYNLQRKDTVPEEVIDRMADTYYYSTVQAPLPVDSGNPFTECIIVDIDGTVAHMGDKRSPYDETKVLQDDPDWTIIMMLRALKAADPELEIIFMSGRHETCREDTEEWLQKYDVPRDAVHMRGADDNRPDDEVKYELYMQHIHMEGKTVQFVLDDRDKVCKMWRKLLKLKVLQVAEGNF